MFINFNKMFAESPPADKEYSRYTALHPTPYQQYIRARRGDSDSGGGSDGTSMTSDDNDYLYHRLVRLPGGTHKHTDDKLILSPSQCKLQPAGLEFFDPKKQVNVINLQLSNVQMKASVDGMMLPQRRSVVKSRTRATQTLFRESSAQTLPYLPGVSNDPEDLETLEIFKLPTILPGDGPPGLYEVEVLERSRRRWAFAKALKDNFRKQLIAARQQAKLQEHEHILEAFEWEHWIEREEYIQECQMLRLELLIRMFDKREREMHTASKTRIQKSCEVIEAKRKSALKKNEVEYNRALRRLEIKHAKQPRVWRKQEISQELSDPSSEFYAPKMRYGVNPSRRHFTASRKGFDMRMDDLEKKAIKMDPKNLKCPFAKLREWSKPKGVLQEVEQNFCSDANLNKLYESLRTLRDASRKQKYTPVCLKAKEPEKMATIGENKFTGDTQTHTTDSVIMEQKSCDDTVNMAGQNSLTQSELDESFEQLRQQKQTEHLNMKLLQNEMRCEELETLINSYEGDTIGWLMRFLSEEMCRLKEQRKLHFIAMMAKRKRWRREAAEAGLRQKENCMRDVYEKLYKDYDNANKEITEKFLNSILSTDIKDCVQKQAEQDVVNIARELDKEIAGWLESFGEVQNPLNYHTIRHALKDIVMPDVEKIFYRSERDDCIQYIINDVLLCKVYHNLEPYDVSFGIANDIVDRLIDNDLYLNSPSCSSEFSYCSSAQQEAKAIIRKVIRYAVPGRRWLTEEERVATENVRDILNDMFDKVITNNCFNEVDMTNPPHIPNQKSHIDLVCFEKYTNIEDHLEESISSNDYHDNAKFKMSHGSYESNDVLINKINYVLPGHKSELSAVHSIPSTHDLSRILEFSTTRTFSQTSSEEFLNKMQLDNEEISIEEPTPTFVSELGSETKGGIPSHYEDFTDQLYSEEDTDVEEEQEMAVEEIKELETFLEKAPTDNDKFHTARTIEQPEEKVISDEDAIASGLMNVSNAYDSQVSSTHDAPAEEAAEHMPNNENGSDNGKN